VRRVILTLLLLMIGLIGGSAWVLTTERGNQHLLAWMLGEKLQINTFQGSLFEGLDLGGISYNDTELQLTIASLKIEWRPLSLFSGLLQVDELTASGVHYTQPGQSQATDEISTPPSLPLAVQLDRAEIVDLNITSNNDTQTITRIALKAKSHQQRLMLTELQLGYADYTASAEGHLDLVKAYPFQLAIQWQGKLPELGEVTGKGEIKGDLNSLTIDHSTLTPFKFRTRGEVTLAESTPSLKLEGDWQQLEWPPQAASIKSSSGRYQLTGPLSNPQLHSEAALLFPGTDTPPVTVSLKSQLSALGLENLSTTIREQRDKTGPAMTLNLQGAIKLLEDGPELAIKGDWSEARWPLLTDSLTQSPKGQFTLLGPLHQLKITSTSTLLFPQKHAPNMETRLAGILSPTGLSALTFESDLLGGKSQVTGEISWEPALNWHLSVTGEALDPALQWPEWPGKLALEAVIKGGENKQGLWLEADLQRLAGTLQQQPISASGQGHYNPTGLRLQNLKLNSGPNQLSANGEVGDALNLTYQLNAPNLSTFWPALKGTITAKGKLKGALTSPEVSSTLKASGLGYSEHGIDQIEGQLTWKKETASVQLKSKGLRSGEWSGRSLSLSLTGRPDNHRTELSLDSDSLILSSTLTGGWLNNHWQGELSELVLTQPQLGRWATTSPATLMAGTEQVKLAAFCLGQNSARLCANGDWTPTNSQLAGQLTTLPLQRILHWLPPEVAVEGAIDGHFQLEGPLTALKGEAKLLLEQGALLLEATEEQPIRLALQDGLLALEMTPKGNRIELALKAGDGEIALQANTAPLTADKPIALSGKVNAQIPDLKPLGLLVPGLNDIQGRLIGDATLGGDLRQPEIQGFMTLSEGSANLPQLGLELREIQLSDQKPRH